MRDWLEESRQVKRFSHPVDGNIKMKTFRWKERNAIEIEDVRKKIYVRAREVLQYCVAWVRGGGR